MPEQDLVAKISQAKGGRKYQSDIDKMNELEFPKRKIIELRSLFRYRLFVPQIEFREKFPDKQYDDPFFEGLNNDMLQWYEEIKDAHDKGELNLGEYALPEYADLIEDAAKGGSAVKKEDYAWFMTSRNEAVKQVGGLLKNE